MADFTSSLYLGLKHSSRALSGWAQLTTGVPAALSEPQHSTELGQYLARMQGCESGIIAPSTLHLYFDLFHLLSQQNITVFMDENIYPVSTHGIEKLVVKNISIHSFQHLNSDHLSALIRTQLQPSTMPVVLTDGFCPQCGRAAPVKEYAAIVRPYDGKIIIDDTQAFGILGKRKDNFFYGYGGGGILQWLNLTDNNIITIVSLAKAFGVPVAVIAGSKNFISTFIENSVTRESASPVSLAHVSAAYSALSENQNSGDERRLKLFQNVSLFTRELMLPGIRLNGSFFPVQNLTSATGEETDELYQTLTDKGFATVLVNNHREKKPTVCIILNSWHTPLQIRSLTYCIRRFYAKAKIRSPA